MSSENNITNTQRKKHPSKDSRPSQSQTTETAAVRRRRPSVNIGMIIFFIILVYLIINVIIALCKDSVSVVEVQNGSIVDNGYYTGIILRSEEVVYSKGSGYINF